MTEKATDKRTLIATYLNTAILIAILGFMVKTYDMASKNGFKTFDSTSQKEHVIDHVENTTFSEMASYGLVNHVKDSLSHISVAERKMYRAKMKRQDSLISIVIKEQWSQGQRLKRIEKLLNDKLD